MKIQQLLFAILFFACQLNAQEWSTYINEDFHFSIYSPAPLIQQTKQSMTDVGNLDVHSFGFKPKEDDPNLLYQVITYKILDSGLEADSLDRKKLLLEEIVAASVDDSGGELQYSELLENSTLSMIWRLQINDEIFVKAKAFVHNESIYIVQVMTYKVKSLNPEVNNFIDSFRYLKSNKPRTG